MVSDQDQFSKKEEKPMLKAEPKETSQPLRNFSAGMGRWMAIFGEAFRQPVSPEQIGIYKAALESELTLDQLEETCQRALKNCRFFPTIADLLAWVRRDQAQAEEAVDKLHADRAWDSLMAHIDRWGADRMPLVCGRRETGEIIFEHAEPLLPEIEWAVRQCGGYYKVATATTENVHFIRKEFLAHFLRYRETGALAAPSREEARRLLAGLQEKAKQLRANKKAKGDALPKIPEEVTVR